MRWEKPWSSRWPRTEALARTQAVTRAQAAAARTTEVWSAKRGLNRDRAESGQGRLGIGGRVNGQGRVRPGQGQVRQGQGRLAPAALRRSSVRAWATLQGRIRPAWAEITHLRPVPEGARAAEAAPTGRASGRPFPSGASG